MIASEFLFLGGITIIKTVNKLDITLCVVAAMLVMTLITEFFIGPPFGLVSVQGYSMQPSIQSGELHFYLNPALTVLERGDVVCFSSENEMSLTKRIVGCPGDTIEATNDLIWINNKFYEIVSGTGSWGPITVPDDAVFCLGDNRRFSTDSRVLGCIPLDTVTAKIIL